MLPMTVLKVNSLKLPSARWARPTMISAPCPFRLARTLEPVASLCRHAHRASTRNGNVQQARPLCLVQYPLDFADRQSGQILVDLTDQPILYRLVQLRSENP